MAGRRRLLLVEDEAVVRVDLKRRLLALDFEVVGEAGDGDAAVKLARELRPHLVLMDVRLPSGVDGIEAAAQIREELGIPSIFLTAYADAQTLGRAKRAQPYGYLLKPIGDSALAAMLETAMYRREAEEASEAAERTHLEAQERYVAILEHSHDGIVTIDRNQEIIAFNQGAARIFGWAPEQAIGKPLESLLPVGHANHHELVAEFASGDRESAAMAARRDVSGRRADGSTFEAEVTISRLGAGDGLWLTAFVRDVSEQRALERTVRRTEQLKVLSSFATGVAHDFNNVLSAIMMRAELARSENQHARDDDLVHIQEAATYGATLVDQLMLFGRERQAQPKEQRVAAIVERDVNMIGRVLGPSISIVPNIGADHARVVMDETQLRQVLFNLVVNARDAMDGKGEVRVRVALESSCESSTQVCIIEVSDDGPGIPTELQARLFEPFVTTKETGTGIGLSTVKEIVLQAGGTISFKSSPDAGTTFRVELPVANGACKQP